MALTFEGDHETWQVVLSHTKKEIDMIQDTWTLAGPQKKKKRQQNAVL